MASYSLAGFVFDKDNNPAPGVKVQGLFVKQLGSSSPTTWSAVATSDSTGYYSLNLGDSTWLDVTGTFGNGDHVLLTFWLPASESRSSTALAQFADYRHILDTVGTSNSHFKRTRLMENIPPNCSFSIPSVAVIDSPVSVINSTTDSPHMTNLTVGGVSGHPIENVVMYQHYSYSGQSIFETSKRIQTDWDWQFEKNGSPNPGVDVESNNNNNLSHTWTEIGDYVVYMESLDASDIPYQGSCYSTNEIRLKYPAPTPDFSWSPYPVGINTDITFVDTTTDPYDRVGTNTDHPGVEYRWYVLEGGSWVYQSGYDNTDLIHQFATNGDHWVRLEIYWNDGFENHIDHRDKKLVISNTPPIADFTSTSGAKCSIEYVFTSTSTDLEGPIIYHEWSLVSLPSLETLSTVGGAAQNVFSYAITETGTYRTILTVTDADGANDAKTIDFEVTEIECCEGGQSEQTILRTMWTPGAAATPSWRKTKPILKAELLSDRDIKSKRKIEGGIIDSVDKKEEKPRWNSIWTEKKH